MKLMVVTTSASVVLRPVCILFLVHPMTDTKMNLGNLARINAEQSKDNTNIWETI